MIILITIFLGGCSSKNIESLVYKKKSCYALTYEEKQVKDELLKLDKDYDNSKNYLPYTITGLGGLISLAPTLFGSSYFYLLPGFTILYYNTTVEYSAQEEHREVLLKKMDKIEKAKEEKHCK